MTIKLVTTGCCDRKKYMPICNCFHATLANNGKIRLFGSTALWCPCAQVYSNLEGQNLDRWNLRSMPKIWYAACLGLSVVNSAQFALEMCHATQNRQKSIKHLFWRSRLSKVIEFGGNRETVYDFLLVINYSKLGPILHRYWDTATYWLKIANFYYPPVI